MIKPNIKWFDVRNTIEIDYKIWGIGSTGNWCLVTSQYDLDYCNTREWLQLQPS